MGIPVVIVASGGLPVTEATNGYGIPMTEATNGFGIPVTFVAPGVGGGALAVTGIVSGPSIQLSAATVAENAAISTVVGTLSVINGTGTYTFTLTDSAGGKFVLGGVNNSSLRTAALLDYETASSHVIAVSATNGVTPIAARNFTISVTDIAGPVITSATTASVVENAVLAHALTAGESSTWTLVGGADQARFDISGSTLRWVGNGVKDFEAPNDANTDNAYVVTVRATSVATGETTNQTVTITVLNDTLDTLVPNAPTLVWTSDTLDTTPNFTVDLPSGFGDYRDAANGDVIYLEITDNISFTTDSTDTLDAGDVAGDIVAMEQTTPLAYGTYYARARLKRGAYYGPYSNVETKTLAAAYTGPGDAVPGAIVWGSSARAYTTAYAASLGPMMILTDQAGNQPVTINATASGFVDVNAITSWVAAGSPAITTIKVKQIYDQTGGNRHWSNTTLASQPTLTLGAINGLPGLTFVAASNMFLQATTGMTATVPYTFVGVGKRTANFTVRQALIGFGTSPNGSLEFGPAANMAMVDSSGSTGSPAYYGTTDNNFHAMIGVIDATTAGLINVNGVEVRGSTLTTAPSTNFSRLGRYAGGGTLDGTLMEAGVWAGSLSGSRTTLNANMHGTSGYNFAYDTSYKGPGDVVSSALGFYSAARAYTAAFAATGAPIMDIVDSAGANPATINILPSGFVDLVTLNAWITAHGTASVAKLYDQTGGGRHLTNATPSQMPTINVSALGSLPGMVFTNAASTQLLSANFTQAQPLSMAVVAARTGASTAGIFGSSSGTDIVGIAGSATGNLWALSANGTAFNSTGMVDGTFGSAQALFNGASSIIALTRASVPFATQAGTVGTGGFVATPISLGRGNAASFTGTIMEAMLWAGDKSASFGALNTNARNTTHGYDF